LTIKAKKERYPNIHVSVAELVGEDINSKISKRKESRFMIGYANITLSPKMMGINFNIDLSDVDGKKQDFYYP